MGRAADRMAAKTGRAAMRSPGRPPVWRREHLQRFWDAIAAGMTSEAAAVQVGVSPVVGTRWFREHGGRPPHGLAALSGRYLSFAEREEIALLRAQGAGVREIARCESAGYEMSTPSCHELVRCAVVQAFARPVVELVADLAQPLIADRGEVDAFREILPQQAVGALVRAALPGRNAGRRSRSSCQSHVRSARGGTARCPGPRSRCAAAPAAEC